MEFHYLFILFTVLFLHMFLQSVNCQQVYLNNTVYDCKENPSAPKGYLCNVLQKSCTSFLVFRSKSPYDNPVSIAYLLGSEASTIASTNNISRDDKIPSNKSIIVPVFCSCSGNIYQHNTPYTATKNDTYFKLVTETYQGLTTCQALMGQNYYASDNIRIGAELTVPVVCTCPTENQTERGVTSLLIYSMNKGDTIKSIGEAYGVDEQSMLEANGVTVPPSAENSITIYATTPIIVPLKGNSCKEDPDSFYCTCSHGMLTNGDFMGLQCDDSDDQDFPTKLVASLGVGIGAGFLCLFLFGYKSYHCIQKKRESIRKEKLFRKNGGYLLQEKLSFYGNGEMAKLFTAEELQRATDNYSRSRRDNEPSLPWDIRLRIACEVAGAGAYMHFSASIPIFHRDIKPTNILLDSNFSAKVSDFGTSRSVPQDKTHLTTAVGGTFGYIDPEYFQSSQFSDKSDVYSFGVVLIELITGIKPISFLEEDEGQNLLAQFISLMKENRVYEILDARVLKEARKEDIIVIVNLAMRCLRLNGKKRPTMKEVSAELEELRKVQSSLQINHGHERRNIDIVQECTEESMSLSLQLESPSF
ncbi:hypothetical protein VNO78_15230 [Psophocarpus tetragonolobus]|uniref:Protein kinase domain-containing protein n=1 Tax=Psophocarpus tetragonolobus TaxID=3891 RepID=A0AAN9XJG0_PSOTE